MINNKINEGLTIYNMMNAQIDSNFSGSDVFMNNHRGGAGLIKQVGDNYGI